MNEDLYNGIFEENIKRGIDSGIITITENQRRITYHCKRDFSIYFKDPKEKVRASYFCELVLDYGYPVKNIDINVKISDIFSQVPIGIIVYDNNGAEFLTVECFESLETDEEFQYAIVRSSANAQHVEAKYFVIASNFRRTVFEVENLNTYKRYKNIIADIPARYTEIPQQRFVKGVKEFKKVSKEEIQYIFDIVNYIAWQGGKTFIEVAKQEVNKLVQVKIKDEATTKYGEAYKFQIETKESPQHLLYKINSIYYNIQQSDDILLQPDTVYKIVEVLQDIELSSAI